MYCKEDYDTEFRQTSKEHVSHDQFINLFVICLRNDSFKIALIIYLCYLNPAEDISPRILDILIQSIKESVKFHEIKLFFIHLHFDSLSMLQMTLLLDTYQTLLTGKEEIKQNPIVHQLNTIKVCL